MGAGQHAVQSASTLTAPLAITKLTQGYDALEDRIRMDVRGARTRVLRIWLTQRLGDALFGHLARSVAAQSASGVDDPGFARYMQVWEQQAAQSQLRPEKPVYWQGDAVLISAADVDRGASSSKITFKALLAGIEHPVATLSLDETRLRQWLGVMFSIYRKAGWRAEVWPPWFATAYDTTATGPNRQGPGGADRGNPV